MSSEACLVFYGVKTQLSESDVDSLERRVHPMMRKAKEHSLDFYWTYDSNKSDCIFAYTGRRIGVIGPENVLSMRLTDAEVRTMIEDVSRRIEGAAISGGCFIHLDFLPDND